MKRPSPIPSYPGRRSASSPLRRRRVEVGEILERSLPTLDRRAREAGVELACEADGVHAAEVETDPEAEAPAETTP